MKSHYWKLAAVSSIAIGTGALVGCSDTAQTTKTPAAQKAAPASQSAAAAPKPAPAPAAPAAAAPDPAAAPPTPPAPAPAAPAAKPAPAPQAQQFSDPDFALFAQVMTGTWKTVKPITAGDASSDVFFCVAPVVMKGVPDAFYAEVVRADAVDVPYRQVILQLHKEGGKTRLRTYEFKRPKGEVISLRTMWIVPQAFPVELSSEDLVTTTDMVFTKDGAVYRGVSAEPYASTTGGAVKITSEMELSAASLKLADRGLAADGSVVWGPAKGEWTAFERGATGITVRAHGEGLYVINYPCTIRSERAPVNDDNITVNYVGTLGNGTIFDASYTRGSPFHYAFDAQLMDGWRATMGDIRVGMKRKLVIPPAMSWGEKGNARRNIPPNSAAYFQVEVLDITDAPKRQPLPVVETKPEDEQQKAEQLKKWDDEARKAEAMQKKPEPAPDKKPETQPH